MIQVVSVKNFAPILHLVGATKECDRYQEGMGSEDPSIASSGDCFFAANVQPSCSESGFSYKRLCCCYPTGCVVPGPQPTTTTPATTTAAPTTSAATSANIGWVLADEGESCTDTCTARSSFCHAGSQRAVDTPAEIIYALAQAGHTIDLASVPAQQQCFYPEPDGPSASFQTDPPSLQYNGAYSSCDAPPTGTNQRLCCCSKIGCATSD
jgi:hypothetical protein